MRDNDNRDGFGSGGGHGQIKPVDFVRTEAQLRPFDGFKPEEIATNQQPISFTNEGPATMMLAKPPGWAQRDDLPCIGRWAEYDEASPGEGSFERAAALCEGCPVLLECRSAALREEAGLARVYRYGVRGGMTPHQRASEPVAT